MAIEMTFTAAIMDFFGYKPGQKLMEFRDELKALDEKDRAYFARELEKTSRYVIKK